MEVHATRRRRVRKRGPIKGEEKNKKIPRGGGEIHERDRLALSARTGRTSASNVASNPPSPRAASKRGKSLAPNPPTTSFRPFFFPWPPSWAPSWAPCAIPLASTSSGTSFASARMSATRESPHATAASRLASVSSRSALAVAPRNLCRAITNRAAAASVLARPGAPRPCSSRPCRRSAAYANARHNTSPTTRLSSSVAFVFFPSPAYAFAVASAASAIISKFTSRAVSSSSRSSGVSPIQLGKSNDARTRRAEVSSASSARVMASKSRRGARLAA